MTPPTAAAPDEREPVRHEWIPLADRDRWRAALDGIDHDFAHTWEYCHALGLGSERPAVLYAFEHGDVRIVCPFQEREFAGHREIATLPGFSGFVGTAPHATFPEHWSAFAAERGLVCGYVGLNPLLGDASYARRDEVHTQNSVYALDLTEGMDALFARLDRNRRRQLRDWETVAESFVTDRSRLADFLTREYPRFLRAVDAASSYDRSEATLRSICGLDDVIVLGTEAPEGIDSVYVFGYTRAVGTCLFHVALPSARSHAAALVWRGVQLLRERGVARLNLGGGIREDDSIATSKQRFGSARVPLRAAKQVYRRDTYEALCRQAGVEPDATVGFFPPYRAPRPAPPVD